MSYESFVKCDECGTVAPTMRAQQEGWIEQHVHAFPFRTKNAGYRTDLHFCSQGCRKSHLENYANQEWDVELAKPNLEYVEAAE